MRKMTSARKLSPFRKALGFPLIVLSALAAWCMPEAQGGPVTVRVTIENLAPTNGTFLTPAWVGFHNGAFDLYNRGEAASAALEMLAEDGDTSGISSDFAASGNGSVDATLNSIGPIGPGRTVTRDFVLDSSMASSRYLSYATMVIPSNDTFLANGNPLAFEVFDASGNFQGLDFIVLGSDALDSGTEVNDEIPGNTAFFGQMSPNTGVNENGVVRLATGFNPRGSGGILDDSRFSGADYTAANYQFLRFSVHAVPEPSTITLAGLGGGLLLASALRRRKRAASVSVSS
jgi:hypothetical protein